MKKHLAATLAAAMLLAAAIPVSAQYDYRGPVGGGDRQWEPWYFQFGVNPVALGVEYPGSTSKVTDSMDHDPFPLGLEMGVYFPMPDQRTLIGGTFTYLFDPYHDEFDVMGSPMVFDVDIAQYLLGFSAMYWIQSTMGGTGPFLRADLGYAMMDLNTKSDLSGSVSKNNENGSGFGLAVGGGYTLPAPSRQSSWVFTGMYHYKNISQASDSDMEGDYSYFSLGVEGLW